MRSVRPGSLRRPETVGLQGPGGVIPEADCRLQVVALAAMRSGTAAEAWLLWPRLGRMAAITGPLSGASQAERIGQIAFTRDLGLGKPRLMKGKASSGVGIYWPVIPKWGDRQVCLITGRGDLAKTTQNEPFIIKYPMAPRPERGARRDGAEFPHPDGHRCRLCVWLGLSGSGRSRPVGYQPFCREGQSQGDAVA